MFVSRARTTALEYQVKDNLFENYGLYQETKIISFVKMGLGELKGVINI